jgi:hypothetical protein
MGAYTGRYGSLSRLMICLYMYMYMAKKTTNQTNQNREISMYMYVFLKYSGTPLIWTPLGPSISGQIIEVSAFQGLLKYGGCGLPL